MRRKMFPPLVFLPVLCYADTSIKKTGVYRMAEQEMLLDSATIKAAVAGEKWATEKVIEHYIMAYIPCLSLMPVKTSDL